MRTVDSTGSSRSTNAATIPRGDPGELRLAADGLRRVCGSCLGVATVRGTAVRDVDLAWRGPAAGDAKAELATLAARTAAVLPQLGVGATAIRDYADELERAQAATRRLRVRFEAVHDEHARERAFADTQVTDPVARQAALVRADQRRVDRLAILVRELGRVEAELALAGARCAATLGRLTSTAHNRAGVRLVEGLPLTLQLLREGTRPPQGRVQPAPEREWWEGARDAAANAGIWVWDNVAVPAVNTAADLAEAVAEHPEDVIGMGFGVGAVVIGAGGELGGLALDATGVGTVVGVPLNVASAAVIATGAAAATASATQLGKHAAANDSMLLKEVALRRGSRGMGGDPLPDSSRPPVAGTTWKGRIANNGNGVVWQRPQDMCPPPKICGANSVRIADPATRTFPDANGVKTQYHYPHGYTRFYNETGQPLRLDGRPGSEAETHLPIRPDGTYDLPRGWNPP